jgi:hypothetical protein
VCSRLNNVIRFSFYNTYTTSSHTTQLWHFTSSPQ